jgi:hypothetical protein
MSTCEPEPLCCWECTRGKVLRLPCGGDFVDCPPANWKWRSCAARLLDTIEKPFRSSPRAALAEGSSEFNCSICNKPVDLKTCKTDEGGRAVHEDCYVLREVLKTALIPK